MLQAEATEEEEEEEEKEQLPEFTSFCSFIVLQPECSSAFNLIRIQ
jgi:hypothetical protein